MKKIYVTAAVIAAMTTAFVSCTNEFENPADPNMAVVEGQTGRVVFNVNTGKSVSFTRSTISEDQVIHSLCVFLYDAKGDRVSGIKQEYTGTDLVDGKLAVSIPSDLMNKVGFKAYLVANYLFGDANVSTESRLLSWISSRQPADVSTKGIIMVSAPIVLNTTTANITAEAVMKRSMSALFVKVNSANINGVAVNAGDFTYKVKNVRVDKGYMFKDEVCEGKTSSATWTPKANTNTDELLGYMYQSDGFEVEITPKPDKPELGSASRTVIVAADKAMKRNKKYLLNVMPTVSESGKVDFTVTVQEWDATDGGFNVDWVERVSVNSRLPQGIITQKGELVATNSFETMGPNAAMSYGPVNNLFKLSAGCRIADVQAVDLMVNNYGLRISNGELTTRGATPLLEDTKGSLLVTTEKEGVQAKERFIFTIKGALARPKEGLNYRWNRENAGWATYDGRFEIQNIYGLSNWDARLPVNEVFDVAKDCQILQVAANEALTQWETPFFDNPSVKAIVGLVDGKVRFRQVGAGFGRINFYVQIKHVPSNTVFVRKMTLRFKGK